MRIRLLLEYDGTDFSGWQVQPGRRTVQGVLQDGLGAMMGAPVSVVGSGRTDAGVHAAGQVAHADVPRAIPPRNVALGLNTALPRDVRVLGCAEAPPGFHAQRSASGKVYRYRILNRRAPSALLRHRAWHVWQPLDLGALRRAAALFIGTRDFAAFRSTGGDDVGTVRDLRRLEVLRDGDRVTLEFEADGFLRHMVRNLTGTLVAVGLGRMGVEGAAALLASRSRLGCPAKAPPQGLTLVEVHYDPPLAGWLP